MNSFTTTKGTMMNRFRLALLLMLVGAVATTAGCSKDTTTTGSAEPAQATTRTVPADEQAARYVDPKVGVKTTPFSVAAPAEHPAKAHTAPAAH